MRIILCILFVFASWLEVKAQTPGMAGELSKYWFYRWRLRNDFMVMGSEAGRSLVIDTRRPDGHNIALWGDATILHGYYLTMLATEHRILQQLGRTEDLKNNERELYYAIKAYERLDYNSETFYSSDPNITRTDAWDINDTPLPGCVNGYVFRDDVPPDFISTDPIAGQINSPTDNYYKLNNGKTGIDYGPMDYGMSDHAGLWKFCQPQGTLPSNYLVAPTLNDPHLPIVNYTSGADENVGCYGLGEESQDQMIRLLLGFQTIVWSVPTGNYGIDLDKNGTVDVTMNFAREARRHATNLIGRASGHLKGTVLYGPNTNFILPSPSQILGSGSFWQIMNPRHKQTSLGGAIYHYLPPMQTISRMLFSPINDLAITTPFYAKASVSSYNASIWDLSWNSGTIGYGNMINAKMTVLLSLLSNTGNVPFHSMGRHIYEKSKGVPGDEDKHFDWHPFYVPLYDYIWGWNPTLQANKDRKNECYDYAKTMMSLAPCIGPHCFKDNPYGNSQISQGGVPDYWNTPMLWDQPAARWSFSYNGSHDYKGHFNGLDYMMLYNLVYANLEEERPLYHDLINRIVDYPINSDNFQGLIEYSGTGDLIGAFEDLTLKSTIIGNHHLEFKALEYVAMEDGYFMDPSSSGSFYIYTDTIKCTSSSYTDWSTPYKKTNCETCDLEHATGTSISPLISGAIRSLREELESDIALGLSIPEDQIVEDENLRCTVYPNPTSSNFVINTVYPIKQVLLYNSLGQQYLLSTDNQNEYSINEFASGVYWLKIIYENDEQDVVKIVRN